MNKNTDFKTQKSPDNYMSAPLPAPTVHTNKFDEEHLKNIHSCIETKMEGLKERVQEANTLEEISRITEHLDSLMRQRDRHSKNSERRRMDNYINWYDNLSPWEQEEHDRSNAFQDRYDMYRSEY